MRFLWLDRHYQADHRRLSAPKQYSGWSVLGAGNEIYHHWKTAVKPDRDKIHLFCLHCAKLSFQNNSLSLSFQALMLSGLILFVSILRGVLLRSPVVFQHDPCEPVVFAKRNADSLANLYGRKGKESYTVVILIFLPLLAQSCERRLAAYDATHIHVIVTSNSS